MGTCHKPQTHQELLIGQVLMGFSFHPQCIVMYAVFVVNFGDVAVRQDVYLRYFMMMLFMADEYCLFDECSIMKCISNYRLTV